MLRKILVLTAISVLVGCGSDPATGGNATIPNDASDAGVSVLFDSGTTFGTPDSTGPQDSTPSDVAAEDATEDAAGVDPCSFSKDPGAGDPGATCASPDDCDSGFCIDTPDGKRCTKTCTACCPNGWKCEQAPGNDTVFICLPKMGALCVPCSDDAACGKLVSGALCVAYAGDPVDGETRFCGGACAADDDCPTGYGCKDAKGSAGQGKQCVKTSGLCACTTKSALSGAKATCSVSNTAGTCTGSRVCTTEDKSLKLSACDAQTPTTETCNGKDDNCDGKTDEGIASQPCTVKNTFGTCAGTQTCAAGADLCDAQTPTIEVCDGKDNDCDGKTDEGCDDDGDGYCTKTIAILGLPAGCTADVATCNQSGTLPKWCAKGIGDCDDSAISGKAVNPGQKELCGNKIDDDCDGQIDLPTTDKAGASVDPIGCKMFYPDVDKDGYGDVTGACLCAANSKLKVNDNTDCDDTDKLINPKAKEICGNGKDDDCNNSQNDADATNCTNYYLDTDGDKYGTTKTSCLCAPLGALKAKKSGDCDDSTTAVNPGVKEACNGIDDDCNGVTDEANAAGCKPWFADQDKDTYGDPKKSACLCKATTTYVTLQAGDCDDSKNTVNKGAKETCGDSLDNDCDGATNEEDSLHCVDYWIDADQDGFGTKKKPSKCLCKKGSVAGYIATKGGDCNDYKTTGGSSYPKATELCDNRDNDCDGVTDEACNLDNDDYCALGKQVIGKPKVCVKGGGDCNDKVKSISPGATEICDNKDNDCDGNTDEGCDDDNDDYCDKNMTTIGTPKTCSKGGGDCADTDKQRNPGKKEICDNKDNNCASGVDEGCDEDNDGWCNSKMTVVGKPSTCLKGGGDCCDVDSKAFPQNSNWYSVQNKCGSWDYNCSSKSEQRYVVKAVRRWRCLGFVCLESECYAGPQGWLTAAPACGVSGTWATDFNWNNVVGVPITVCVKAITKSVRQTCH